MIRFSYVKMFFLSLFHSTAMPGNDQSIVENVTGSQLGQKAVTKAAMFFIPKGGNVLFNKLGEPAARELFNIGVMGADHGLDEMRDSKTGPYREN